MNDNFEIEIQKILAPIAEDFPEISDRLLKAFNLLSEEVRDLKDRHIQHVPIK